MMQMQICQFTSASSKGDVYVCPGFVPDFVIGIFNMVSGQTPDIQMWANPATLTLWPAAVLLITGSTGATSVDADAGDFFTAYAGGDIMDGTETAATDGKHVDHEGVLIPSGHYTPAGVFISDEHQTNSGVNFLLCFRRN
jgi:hypothetical protein